MNLTGTNKMASNTTSDDTMIKTPISRAQELVADHPGNLDYNPFAYSEGLARRVEQQPAVFMHPDFEDMSVSFVPVFSPF